MVRRNSLAQLFVLFFIPWRKNRRQSLFIVGTLLLAYILLSGKAFLLLWHLISQVPDHSLANNLYLYRREILSSEPWPEIEGLQWTVNTDRDFQENTSYSQGTHFYQTFPIASVHVIWCGSNRLINRNITNTNGIKVDPGIFRFENHLALLSALRVLKPLRLVVHYIEPPRADSRLYHTWWEELRQSVPTLVLKPSGSELMLACEKNDNRFSVPSLFDLVSSDLPPPLKVFPISQRAFLTFALRQLANEKGAALTATSLVATRKQFSLWTMDVILGHNPATC
ncbi:hypothetical protein PoB_004634600 [Plakobranchus ocellatus]|uniref:Glycosyltransferase family 92 protein n=1 Tax=Plakobranchus ocellatus TaxID=259542 RepID=A0AAV4B8Z4_9GAST|nr:hypothetical protein PoB_004634600 [Plakobranchus ocellatus]